MAQSNRTNFWAAVGALLVMALAVLAFQVAGGDESAGPTTETSTAAAQTTTATAEVPTDATSTTVMPQTTEDGAAITAEPEATTQTTVAETVVRYSDLPLVSASELPPEAHDTLVLIARDTEYPYRQDGGTFQNREELLPDQPRGYYREFTVETPGSPDRGARRIVTGVDGEAYYTEDHYASFREIDFTS